MEQIRILILVGAIIVLFILAFIRIKSGNRFSEAPVKPIEPKPPPGYIPKKPFTPKESKVMDCLVAAHNNFMSLQPCEQETKEWILSLHHLQDILGHRVLKRDYPNHFK